MSGSDEIFITCIIEEIKRPKLGLGRMFYRYLLGPFDLEYHIIQVFLYGFVWVSSIGKSGVLKSLTIIVL